MSTIRVPLMPRPTGIQPTLMASDMTLRDTFAVAALSALIAIYDREQRECGAAFNISDRAFGLADSMLEARKS